MHKATPLIFTEASGHLPASGSPGGCGFPHEAETPDFCCLVLQGRRAAPDSRKIGKGDRSDCSAPNVVTVVVVDFYKPVKLVLRTTAWRVTGINDLIGSFRRESDRS